MQIDKKYENKYLKIVKDIVLANLKNYRCKVFLFGSRAINKLHWASDIDIGIEGLDTKKFNKIRREVSLAVDDTIVPFEIDIVNFNEVSNEFKRVALRKIILWKSK